MNASMRGRQGGIGLLIGVLAVGALGAYVGLRFEASTDIAHLLPSTEHKRLARVARELVDSELSRSMIVAIGGPDETACRSAASELADTLEEHPEVAWLQRGPAKDIGDAFYSLYHPRRLSFVSADPENELPTRLQPAGLAAAATELKRQLGSPTGMLVKRVARGDPLLAFPAFVDQLQRALPEGVSVKDDQFMARDGKHALLFIGTKHSAMHYESQAPLLTTIEATFAAINGKPGDGKHEGALKLLKTGVHRHAVLARERIEGDIKRISAWSTAAIVLLFILLFRSLRILAVGLIPLAVGVLGGVAATLASSGKVHGLTMTFGATLIGVCLDYPVHLINHHMLGRHGQGPAKSLSLVWTGLWLGALTTLTGFVGLLASSLPAVREVAIFATSGITAALLATRFIVTPLLPRAPREVPLQVKIAAALQRLLASLSARRRLMWTLPAIALVVGLAGATSLKWQDDVRSLTRQDPVLKAEDEKVRALVSSYESARVVLVSARTIEAALQVNDRLFERMKKARADGLVGDFRSLHRLLWSASLQRRNRAELAKVPNLAANIGAALEHEGFVAGAFSPFAQALARPIDVLTWEHLAKSPLAPLIRPFRISTERGVGLLTFVRDVKDPKALATAVEEVDGAVFFDQPAFISETFGSHRSDALFLILVGLFAIVGVLFLRYRNIPDTALAAAPALLAGFATLGLLSLLGEELNLLHVASWVLVCSMGVDYGVFLAESTHHDDGQSATLLSIVVACISTVAAFGLLALSDNPALRAVGLTTGIGVLASFVLAPPILVLTRRSPPPPGAPLDEA